MLSKILFWMIFNFMDCVQHKVEKEVRSHNNVTMALFFFNWFWRKADEEEDASHSVNLGPDYFSANMYL